MTDRKPTNFNFLALPVELRLIIYSFMIGERSTRIGILSCNRKVYEEVVDVLYKDQDLVFTTHPYVLSTSQMHDKSFVTIQLRSKRGRTIDLPSLPRNIRLMNRMGTRPRRYQYLPLERLKGGRIIVHIHETPKNDPGQVFVTWLCLNMIKEFFISHDQYPHYEPHLNIVVNPQADSSSACAQHCRWLGLKWKSEKGYHLIWARTSSDLPFMLSSLWFNFDACLDLHVTDWTAEKLALCGLWTRMKHNRPRINPNEDPLKYSVVQDGPDPKRVDETSMIQGGAVVRVHAKVWPRVQDKPNKAAWFCPCKEVFCGHSCIDNHVRRYTPGKTADYCRAHAEEFRSLLCWNGY
ncbi:hypothetical protein FH972_023298 [Carpinus fangiana]|uniref:F-box domain-containing protein n=1 Tax=Carpinus fangiana TaxID=176857 RepID=A0A5N6KVA2_9ROSI|nr:hypothetical protein FH972_023298 [Carpinus fangiana]